MNTVAKLTAFFSLIAVMALTSGCNKNENDLLGSVPSTSEMVMLVDLDDIMDNAGIKEEGGKLSEQLVLPLGSPANTAELNLLLSLSHAMSDDEFAIFLAGKNSYLTFRIDDPDKLDAVMAENGLTLAMVDGYKTWELEKAATGDVLLAKDGQGWIVEGSADSAVKAVESLRDEIKKNGSFMDRGGLCEYLTSADADVAFVGNVKELGLGDNVWLGATCQFNSDLLVTLQLLAEDGEPLETDVFGPINTDFLRYVPADFNAALAIGVADTPAFVDLLTKASGVAGYRSRGFIEAIIPFLSKVDGTISLAAKLPTGDAPGALAEEALANPMLVMMQMKQADVNETMDGFASMLRSMGANVVPSGNGYKATAPGMTLYIASEDGQLALSTFELNAKQSNAMNTSFNGFNAGMYLLMPANTFGVNSSRPIKLNVSLQTRELKIKVSFADNTEGFLKCLRSL